MKHAPPITVTTDAPSPWAHAPRSECSTRDWCHDGALATHPPRRRAEHPGEQQALRVMRHYDALLEEALRVGWPIHHKRDLLVHDRHHLSTVDAVMPFFWALRTCGTCLYLATEVPIGRSNGRPQYAWDAPHFVARAFGDDHVRFYTWHGCRLHEHRDAVTASAVVRELAEATGRPTLCRGRWRAPQCEHDRRGAHEAALRNGATP